jgi:hypothetical protein
LRRGITGCGQQATADVTVKEQISGLKCGVLSSQSARDTQEASTRRGGVLIKYLDNLLSQGGRYHNAVMKINGNYIIKQV